MKNDHLGKNDACMFMLSGLRFKHLEVALDLISSHVIFFIAQSGFKGPPHPSPPHPGPLISISAGKKSNNKQDNICKM